MKHKKLSHIALIVGDFALFFGTEAWVEMLFLFGAAGAIGFRAHSAQAAQGLITSMFYSGALYDLELKFLDVIQLLYYPVLVLGLLAFLLARTGSMEKARRDIRLQLPVRTKFLPVLPVIAVGAFLAVTAIFALIPEDAPIMVEYAQASEMLLDTATPFLSFLVTVVCAPFVEEFFFRGLIYNHLKVVFPKRKWIALLLQGLLFGVAHGQLLWILYAALLGLVFGMVYDYFDSLPTSIFIHLLFNFSNYLPWPETMFEGTYTLLIVLFSALLGLSLILLLLALGKRKESNPLKAG